MLLAITILAFVTTATLNDQPVNPTAPALPTTQATPSALSRFTAADGEKVKRRAQYVYELPDGTIFDSFYYVEFRNVLDEYDGPAKDDSPVPGRALAWGFTEKNRYPSKKRPDPLWHTVAKRDPTSQRFVYVNSTLDTRREIARGRQFTLTKETAENLYSFTYDEFPGADSDAMRMPGSVVMSYATGVVRVERDQQAKIGTPRTGEFFLFPDNETTEAARRVPDAIAGVSGFRIVQARDLRLDPERYAQALLDGRAELLEWSFKRTTGRLGDTYTWTSVKLPIPKAGGE